VAADKMFACRRKSKSAPFLKRLFTIDRLIVLC
jgi:hypothetical protein